MNDIKLDEISDEVAKIILGKQYVDTGDSEEELMFKMNGKSYYRKDEPWCFKCMLYALMTGGNISDINLERCHDTINLNELTDEMAKKILGTVFDVSDNSEPEFCLMHNGEKVCRRTDPDHFGYALEKVMTWKKAETKRLCDNIIYACAVAAAKYKEPIPYITAFWSEIFSGTRDTTNQYYDEPSKEVFEEIETRHRSFVMPDDGEASIMENEFKGNDIVIKGIRDVHTNIRIDHQIRRAKVTPYLAQMIKGIRLENGQNVENIFNDDLQGQSEYIKKYLPELAQVCAEQAKLMSWGIIPSMWERGTNWYTDRGLHFSSAVLNHYYCEQPPIYFKGKWMLDKHEEKSAESLIRQGKEGITNTLQIVPRHTSEEAKPFATKIPDHVEKAIAGLRGLPVSIGTGDPYWELCR